MPQRGSRARHRVLAGLLSATLLATAVATTAPAGADEAVDYEPPVTAPVVDPFRVDHGPYGAGNRGLDYGTAPGTAVRAAADGVVTFAGTVGRTRHVTVLHDDGVRTTYSFLDEVRVLDGQRVRQGQVLGTTVDDLHFGARRGDAYFDPATLFDGGPVVYLVPFDIPPGFGPGSEQSAIRQLIGGIGGGLRFMARAGGGAAGAAGAGISWVSGKGGAYAQTLVDYVNLLGEGNIALALFNASTAAWNAWRRECTRDSTVVPPLRDRRAAVLVGGLASSDEDAAVDDVDTTTLGFRPDDVVRYSYAGGRTPLRGGRGATFARLPEHAYGASDTLGDIFVEAEQFADFVEMVAAEEPGMPVDIIAHSQGGLVARRGIEVLGERHGPQWVLDHVDLLATIATPHGGADLATAGGAVNRTNIGNAAFDGAEVAGLPDVDSDAVGQLGEHSRLIDHFRATPVLEGLNAIAIASSGDWVVPVPRSRGGDMRSSVVHAPIGLDAHDRAPSLPGVTRELALALDRRPPGCRGFWEAFSDEVIGQGLSAAEDGLGAILWTAAVRFGG